jgi:hypothetical protein
MNIGIQNRIAYIENIINQFPKVFNTIDTPVWYVTFWRWMILIFVVCYFALSIIGGVHVFWFFIGDFKFESKHLELGGIFWLYICFFDSFQIMLKNHLSFLHSHLNTSIQDADISKLQYLQSINTIIKPIFIFLIILFILSIGINFFYENQLPHWCTIVIIIQYTFNFIAFIISLYCFLKLYINIRNYQRRIMIND